MIRCSLVLILSSLVSLHSLAACGDDAAPPVRGTLLSGGAAGMGGEGGEGGGACVPRSCQASGVVCGVLDDGCGSLVECDAGCGTAGHAGEGGCVSTTCAAENKNCGRISDGCGVEIDCGTCDDAACGEVVPNVCGCPPGDEILSSPSRSAGRAVSIGFSGTDAEYLELYEVGCNEADACEDACRERGGSEDMCQASECLASPSGDGDCLPAPVWSNLQGIQAESQTIDGAAQLIVVATTYHDLLLTSAFELELPDAAEIRGITVKVRRAGDASISDDAVRIVKSGELAGANRSRSGEWTEALDWITYGGEDDLWGEDWSPADLRADDFGVALSVNYEETVGNARAYVDQVHVTIHYTLACED
jgi:hypothetical protein